MDVIFDNVIADEAVRPKRRWGTADGKVGLLKWGLVTLLVAAAVPLFLVWGPYGKKDGEFGVKGTGRETGFAVRCVDETETSAPCRVGNTMLFQLHLNGDFVYFSAFSKHKKSGRVVWYFPAEASGMSIRIQENLQNDFLTDGVVLGDEHHIGDYVLYGVFSKTALTRGNVKQLFDTGDTGSHAPVSIVETTLTIQ